jgi:RNA polymerase sigma-70 factor, ECF subfamily
MIRAMTEGYAAEVAELRVSDRCSRPVAKGPDRDSVLRSLVADHFDFVWRSVRRIGLCPADADDVTQEAFVVASRKLEELLPGRERAFLLGTALRVASTFRRGARREQARRELAPPTTADPFPAPDHLVESRSARERLDLVLGEIDLELRTVFVLFEVEELSVGEIADLVGLKPGTVASRLRRAREAFRTAVERMARREARGGAS